MKWCLRYRQSPKLLAEVDEIFFDSKDIDVKKLYRLIDKFPDKTFILDIPPATIVLPEEIQIMAKKVHIICRFHNKKQIDNRPDGINFYYAYPIQSYYELMALRQMGVCYVVLGAPLFFELETVKSFGIPIRLAPNVAYYGYLSFGDGVCGTWIRPEDIETYGKYVDTMFFETSWAEREKKLYEIYSKDREWKGQLNLIIDNLKCDVKNPAIYNRDNQLVEARMKCGQKCMKGFPCHICEESLIFGLKVENYLKENPSNLEEEKI